MANDNLPKKLSFWDKFKMLFSTDAVERLLQSNSTFKKQITSLQAQLEEHETRRNNVEQRAAALIQQEADLEKREEALIQQEADLAKRATVLDKKEKTLSEKAATLDKKLKEAEDAITFAEPEARRRARKYADIEIERAKTNADTRVAQIQAEADAKVAQAQAEAEAEIQQAEEREQQAEEREAEAKKLLKDKVSSGEITAGKGEQGASMTVFFEQYIIEATEKLKADISELRANGGNPELKQGYIAEYQANLLGTLLAYMDFDTITRPETKQLTKTKIQEAIISISNTYPQTRKTFIKSFICTKYQAYDGKFQDSPDGTPYKDINAFIDRFGSNSSYFEGKTSDFTDPVCIVCHFDKLGPYRKHLEFRAFDHFLLRTDFSSHEFRLDPNLKVKQHSDSEKAPTSYTPDLNRVIESKVPDEFEIS